jgi:uncharacterized protein YcfL
MESMKKSITFTSLIGLVAILLQVMPACSSRNETPFMDADSAKKSDGISAKMTLCRKVSKKTGKLIDAGNVFTIKEDEMVHAIVELENRFAYGDRELMFHFDWIDKDGSDLFMKRIDLAPDDTTATIKSSVSISPEKRQPGEYLVRLYLFRELIAEKKFELLPESSDTVSIKEPVPAKDVPTKKTGKKTGKKKKAATD